MLAKRRVGSYYSSAGKFKSFGQLCLCACNVNVLLNKIKLI